MTTTNWRDEQRERISLRIYGQLRGLKTGQNVSEDEVIDAVLELLSSAHQQWVEELEKEKRKSFLEGVNNICSSVDQVIDSWIEDLGIEKDWIDNLHPADALDKHIFKQLYRRMSINEAIQVSKSTND